MEQTIAAEWGRFLRDLEAKGIQVLSENNSDNQNDATPGTRRVHREGTKQAVWQRLQDAIAMPPEPDVPLFDESSAAAADQAHDEAAGADRSFLEQFTRSSTEDNIQSARQNATAGEPSGSELQSSAKSENSSFQVRSMWIGTGFEERRVLVAPPAADASAPEQQEATNLEDTSVETPSWTTNERLEEKMWNSFAYEDAPESSSAASNGTSPHPTQNQDSSRWYMLNGVLGGAKSQQETPADAPDGNVPLLEVFSLAGGVGKTSLVATLGRALSALGEKVLLVEATPFGTLPYFFGACDSRPGALRTFRPPSSSSDAPIRLISVDPEPLVSENAGQASLATEIQDWSGGASRVIVDVGTGSTQSFRELSRMSPLVLVPLIPDINSVLTANAIESLFQRQVGGLPAESDVYYVLNQFDPSLPLHADVRNVLQERLGERLLPFALERTPAVSEALAEGMTIMDYAPDSPMAEGIITLAKWLEDVMAPADLNSRGRWSER